MKAVEEPVASFVFAVGACGGVPNGEVPSTTPLVIASHDNVGLGAKLVPAREFGRFGNALCKSAGTLRTI